MLVDHPARGAVSARYSPPDNRPTDVQAEDQEPQPQHSEAIAMANRPQGTEDSSLRPHR